MEFKELGYEGVNWWIQRAQGRDKWWALVNTVMNLSPIKWEECLH
jgi:hypothetical protein